jgi:poly(A) polymerase
VLDAMRELADRLGIVSVERISDELDKLLCGAHPRAGLEIMVETGLAEHVLPELPALRLEIDEHHQHKDVYDHTLQVLERAIALEQDGPDLVLRLAALLHDIGKPRTRRKEPGGGVSFHHHEVVGASMARRRLTALRYPKDVVAAVVLLTELHLRFHGYRVGGGPARPGQGSAWTDSAVRRYVTDAGDQLERLHKLVRSDCTTRNRRRAAALAAAYDDLEARIAALAETEELSRIRPTSTARRSWSCWASSRDPSSVRRTGTCASCGWTVARCRARRRSPSCSPGRAPRGWPCRSSRPAERRCPVRRRAAPPARAAPRPRAGRS